jgi:hypothetical protein
VAGLKMSLPPRHHHLIAENQEAINRGIAIVKKIGDLVRK